MTSSKQKIVEKKVFQLKFWCQWFCLDIAKNDHEGPEFLLGGGVTPFNCLMFLRWIQLELGLARSQKKMIRKTRYGKEDFC